MDDTDLLQMMSAKSSEEESRTKIQEAINCWGPLCYLRGYCTRKDLLVPLRISLAGWRVEI